MFEGLFQPMHLLVIFFIALLVFGPKKLPELGKGIGEGIRALKEGMKDGTSEQAKTPSHRSEEYRTEELVQRSIIPSSAGTTRIFSPHFSEDKQHIPFGQRVNPYIRQESFRVSPIAGFLHLR